MTTVRATRRPWLLALGLALLVVAVALSVAARATLYFGLDLTLTRALQGQQRVTLDVLLHTVNTIGNTTGVLSLVAVLCLLWWRVGRHDLIGTVALAVGARVAIMPLKPLIDRPRPSVDLVRVTEFPGQSSFPSGHVLTAVLCFGLLTWALATTTLPARLRGGLQVGCLALIALMGPARIYVGAHWPSDALGGYLWGALLLLVVVALARRRGWLVSRPHRDDQR